MSRLIAIGDIHGTHHKLVDLLNKLNLKKTDEVIFLGDYIDRGYYSYEVIQTLIDLRNRYPKVTLLRGNHEQLMIDAKYGDASSWMYNGANTTLESFYAHNTHPRDFADFFETLPIKHRVILPSGAGTYYFSHAGWDLTKKLSKQYDKPDAETLLWERAHVHMDRPPFAWDGIAVFGHTPLDKPLWRANCIGVDTGAVFGGPLTAAILPQTYNQPVKFVQAYGDESKIKPLAEYEEEFELAE